VNSYVEAEERQFIINLICNATIPLLHIDPKEVKICVSKDLYANVHKSFIPKNTFFIQIHPFLCGYLTGMSKRQTLDFIISHRYYLTTHHYDKIPKQNLKGRGRFVWARGLRSFSPSW
jgi:hypothetical protein